ncbi:S41 family peptidase [Antarcticibacterium sp. 1MA-6-2]|uniref:S41 family peptidase n=1 Tax=Antarcticibacterium sp. 1MA-6-2 TaxID=2908210 RepID=UPI001F37C156|nr:S41 family peptidase [Antarcticibacterium sp. 1MA-6-2]UJH91965.1 S41 family peptidase [Antarcticibacterium sp. 1MA-6-2]
MKLTKNNNFLLIFLLGLLFSCSADNEEFIEEETENNIDNPASTIIKKDLEVQKFIYRGMSDIYLYNSDVDLLASDYFATQEDKEDFLDNYTKPEDLFERLMASHDRFSYIMDDYNDYNKTSGGLDAITGMSYGLVSYCTNCSEVFGYVKLVLPGSNADDKGVKRGMIFNRIDGQQITTSNYNELLDSNSFSIGLAKIEDNTISELDQTITISEREQKENPIAYNKVMDIDGEKVGYLYYNSFDEDYDEDLNNAFKELKGAGVTELVLDLRYNGGGSVRTATDLAAMITKPIPGQLFMKEKWNQKYQKYYEQNKPEYLLNNFNKTLRTGTPINSLNLSRVFVLTTASSASASELIINGLDPYIDVVQIGDVTTGKFQASVTLYDSEDFSKDHASLKTTHKYAMQPLVLKSHNAHDVSDYVNGLTPDITLKENVRNLGILGDPSEPLLKVALDVIKGNRVSIPEVKEYKNIGESGMFEPEYQRMYIDKLPEVIE